VNFPQSRAASDEIGQAVDRRFGPSGVASPLPPGQARDFPEIRGTQRFDRLFHVQLQLVALKSSNFSSILHYDYFWPYLTVTNGFYRKMKQNANIEKGYFRKTGGQQAQHRQQILDIAQGVAEEAQSHADSLEIVAVLHADQ